MKRREEAAELTAAPVDLPLYGDVLESVVSHVPTPDLLQASSVSSAWLAAVVSSLRRSPRPKPLLLLHLLPRGPHRRHTSLAYDPYSLSWAPLPASHSAGPISPSLLLPRLPPPQTPRTDPLLSLAGPFLVLAGGSSPLIFSDDPRAVEVLDLRHLSAGWTSRDSIPLHLSNSATWLSAAASADLLHVLDRHSGNLASFDPQTGRWSRTRELKPDAATRAAAIGFTNGRLVLAGLSGSDPDPMRITVWEVDLDSEPAMFKEIGRMPAEMVGVLAGSGFGLTTIGFGLVEGFGYFYNPADFSGGAVFWEVAEERWERVERPSALDGNQMARISFDCARMRPDNLKISVL